MSGDDEQARAAVELATSFLTAARELEPRRARARGRRLRRLFDDPDSMAFSLALTDQVARIQDPARATQRLRELLSDRGSPRFLGPVDGLLLRAAGRVSSRLPALVAAGVRWRLRHESAGVVLAAEEPAFTRYVTQRTDEGVRLNVNVLGEAILGDDEARRRLDQVLARVERPDVDYVSVKVSSICAQLSPLAFDRSVERVAERLRVLYRRAAIATPRTFVNLDMEEYGDLALTVAVFQRVLDEPELLPLDAGVALQAYLPDSHEAFEELAAWAAARRARGGGRIKVRIVKGANLAMEQVEAELRGWPQAPYPTKAEVDASYKRLLDRALDPRWGDAVRVGLASHNLFDVAWGIVRATHLGSLDRLELEMLEGMAVGEAEAIRRHMHQLLLYAPVVRRDEFDAAIAYLVRRLDENTSADNFLRHQFELTPTSRAFAEQRDRFLQAVAARHRISTATRRVQDRATGARAVTSSDAEVGNTPDTDWSRRANRDWLAAHHAELPEWMPTLLRLAGAPATGAELRVAVGIDPAAPAQVLYRYELADAAAVDRAVTTAGSASSTWGRTTTTHRAALLRRGADVLEENRGRAIATMARDAGKTATEADVEVSEAIDMARYYAAEALRLDEREATPSPLGPVVVAPPWNFPYAIPAGGVLAALAAGNTVILKPAPETVLTAWLLVTCLWDAGIPRDVLQLLPCPDDDVGRALITHPDVGAVVLTGAAETAERFLSWRPDLRLHAETSGKNAIVVTAAADLDLAVKDLVRSAFGHAGQKCSAASLAIVERSVLEDGRFLAKLADATRTLHVGAPTDPAVDVGPLIRPPAVELQRALTTLEPGERWLVRPRQLDEHGHLWSPGIKVGVAPGSFFHLTECFGPVLGVLAADDLDHALDLQNATPFGLTGGLQSLDPHEIARWVAGVEVGNAYVNRGITGAIVRRQPFGGWKRSTVGPAVKAGGPAYVASLCRWTDPPGSPAPPERARAEASYTAAWSALARPEDPTGLRVERNQLRHLPLPGVLLRISADADPADEARCRLAAATVGTPLQISHETDEPDAAFVTRLATIAPKPTRLRVLGTARPVLWRAAADAGVHLDDRAPVDDGMIELLRWCREQAVSSTAHRHGAPSPDLVPALGPPTGT